jgi:hypothetical protein
MAKERQQRIVASWAVCLRRGWCGSGPNNAPSAADVKRAIAARSVTQTYSAVHTSVGAGIGFQKNIRFPVFQEIAIKELPGPGISKSRHVSSKNRNIPGIILGDFFQTKLRIMSHIYSKRGI